MSEKESSRIINTGGGNYIESISGDYIQGNITTVSTNLLQAVTQNQDLIDQNIKLSGKQRQKLQNALISAFPSKSSLQQMLSFKLDKNLDVIAGGNNLQEIIFSLIVTAEAEGWTKNLVRAAYKTNPGNPKLKFIFQELSVEN